MYCPKCATLQSDDQKFCRSCGQNLEFIAEIIGDKSKADKIKAVFGIKAQQKKRKNRLESLSGLTIIMSLFIGCLIPVAIGLSYLIILPIPLMPLILILSGIAGITLFGGISLAIYGDMSQKTFENDELPKSLSRKNINELSSADNFELANSLVEQTTRTLETNKIKLGR